MDDYHKIAYDYFQTFEGKKLYPKPAWWHGIAVLLTATALWLLWPSTQPSHIRLPDWAFVFALAPVMFTFLRISEQRKAMLMAHARASGAASISDFKRMELTRLLHSPSTAFGETARQILELRHMQQNTQMNPDFSAKRLWGLIYDKSAKDRLMTVSIAGLSVLLALVDKFDIVELPPMIEILGDDGFWQFMAFLLIFVTFLWLLAVCVVFFTQVAAAGLTHIAAAIGWLDIRNPMMLNYLLNDLVQLHEVSGSAKSGGPEKRRMVKIRSQYLLLPAKGEMPFPLTHRNFRRRTYSASKQPQ